MIYSKITKKGEIENRVRLAEIRKIKERKIWKVARSACLTMELKNLITNCYLCLKTESTYLIFQQQLSLTTDLLT